MVSYLKKRPHYLILILVLILALFFRTYKVIDRFEFAHDGDLYSWIVKDIVVDGHLRLVGQETSAPGIFIGPLFYYLLIPFFLLTNMDPVGAIIPITIIGVLTVFSYFWVFTRLFNIKIGLIAAFLYTVLLETVQLDRRVVPSTPTNLWVIWYFFTIVSLARGHLKVLPLLGILIGLIWHIHIALAPPLIAAPIAILLSRKIPKVRQILYFLLALFITSLPLLIFEVKHGFIQGTNFINNFGVHYGGVPADLYKLQVVLDMITKNINTLFFAPYAFKFTQNIFFVLLILLSMIYLLKKKIINYQVLTTFYIWILGVVLFFSISQSPVSEYYFFNIEIIFIFIISAYVYLLSKKLKVGTILVVLFLSVVAIKNAHFLINQNYYHKGYKEKKAVVEFIKEDAYQKGFPCMGITYITTPGENVGFRYFFYLQNLHLVHPSTEVPVYNIVIPEELSNEVHLKFAHIGLILPSEIPSKEIINKSCSGPNTNLTDPMFGFVR